MRLTQLVLSLATTAALFAGRAAAADGDFIWVEGESAASKTMQPHSWYDSIKKGQLSGGEWVSNFGGADGLADYQVEAPKAGDYTLWVRANPIGAALAYKIGDAEWKEFDFAKAVDQVNMASDDKPDMRFLAWVNGGKVALKQGKNAVSFKMHSGNQHHGAIDCFVFAAKPFTPQGSSQPGKKLGLADAGTWAFEPDADEFDAKSLLDLRSLNEKKAGETGWVTRTPDGDFANGAGKPLRFWAANTGVFDQDDEALKAHARFIAKRGVNLVRFHGHFQPPNAGSQVTDVDASQIDKAQRLVATMKAEGVYTTISMYWATSGPQESWGIQGHKQGAMFGMLFWDETLQKGYKAWIKELLTRPNPHAGGTPLGQDPALAILQIQNEDSMLFWTMLGPMLNQDGQHGEEQKRLRACYGKWLAKKYGDLDKAFAAWGGDHADGDDAAGGSAGFKPLWEYGNDVSGSQRFADQLQFCSETMRDFNAMIDDYVHKELKCPVLINAGNWRTANQVKMLDAERYSYGANQVTGLNRYVSFAHENPSASEKAGYLVAQGDRFEDLSTLKNPRSIAVSDKQVAGSPFIISESSWVSPMGYQSEGPFLVAAYSSLTGVDAYYWFALGSVGYDRTINKWQAANPALMGGWPAAAWMFRKGYIKKGEPAVHEERSLDDVWHGKGIIIAEDEGFDPNRDSGTMPKESNVKAGANPLAFLVGPVEAVYGGDAKKSKVADLAKYIDDGKKTVTSITGELALNYDTGLCRLDAPKAQGASGFLSKGGALALSTLGIDAKNDYATILAVSMDDKDLKESAKILVQATTICRPYHWKQTATEWTDHDKHAHKGFQIDDTGQEPWNVALTQATITLKNPKLKKATVLDPNGMAIIEIPGEQKGGVFTLTLPPNALYVILQ